MTFKSLLTATALLVSISAHSRAAYIVIRDSDVNTITITAGDFQGGFFVNGNLLTTGFGQSNSITLADGMHSFSGDWTVNGWSSGAQTRYFADSNNPSGVLSGINIFAPTYSGNISGEFYGYTGAVYFNSIETTFQQGTTQSGGYPFLSYSFVSEAGASVPDSGATVLMLGMVFAGFAASRRMTKK